MKDTMNRFITDDQQVQALAERFGVWATIAAQIAADQSGTLVADGWVFLFFQDGLVALKTDDPVEIAMLTAAVAAHINGPKTYGIGFHKPPVTH